MDLENVIFVTFLLFLIIFSAIFGEKHNQVERFYASTNANRSDTNPSSDNNITLLKKSSTYFPYVKTFFMSDNATNIISNNCDVNSYATSPCLPLTIFKFLPTYLDALCSFKSDSKNLDYCKNFYVDNNTTNDPFHYDSPQVCQNINGNVGQNKDQSVVRILNNNYHFMKRCISLKVLSVTTLSGTGKSSNFKVVCNGNISLFVLLRPCMIMFPGIGLFNIHLFGTEPSSLTYFSDSDSTFSFIMRPISETSLMPEVISTISTASFNNVMNNVIYPSIYYFNFLEAADFFPANAVMTLNTLTLIFDDAYMKNNPDGLYIKNVGYSSTVNVCTSLHFKWDNNLFRIDGNCSIVSNGNFTYKAHEDYTTKCNNALGSGTIKHVIVSYSMDLLTIVTCFKDLNISGTSKNCFFTMVQYPVSSQNTVAVYNQYLLSDINQDITGNASFCSQTEIPNIASLVKQLGYAFV